MIGLIGVGLNFIEDKEDRWGRHVPVRSKDTSRYVGSGRIQLKCRRNGIEDSRSSGMDGPRYISKTSYAMICEPGVDGLLEFLFNHARHLCRELHLESVIPDAPGHHFAGSRDEK